jgi:hypothetical protein
MLKNPLSYQGTKGKSISVIFMLILFLPLIAITLALFYISGESLISQKWGEFVLMGVLSVFCALITAGVWRHVRSKQAALAEQENKEREAENLLQ